ncbi:nuclear transport factor 2 family protein [Sphingobium sp. AN558]|uniref:nuclear transport factor 2 family protein n=1 Tax=Sphingobium sp. AN558 TaxID=3133442 RepID=UPI0030C29F82
MQDEVERLVAVQAIQQVIYQYCRAMDRIDHQLGYSVWHSDGIADYGAIFQGTGVEFIDWVCEYHRKLQAQFHRVSNITININGRKACSETYVKSTLYFVEGEENVLRTGHGRYLDTWSCRDGRWAIDVRSFVLDFVVTEVPKAVKLGSSTRDVGDPSYAVLSEASDVR